MAGVYSKDLIEKAKVRVEKKGLGATIKELHVVSAAHFNGEVADVKKSLTVLSELSTQVKKLNGLISKVTVLLWGVLISVIAGAIVLIIRLVIEAAR